MYLRREFSCIDVLLTAVGTVKDIRICSWNINGLSHSKLPNIVKVMSDFDIVLIQETCIGDRVISIDNFESFHLVRPKQNPKLYRGAGGISIYVKNKWNVSVLKNHNEILVWLNVDNYVIENKSLIIGCVYFPPEGSNCNTSRDDYFTLLEDDLQNLQIGI